MKKLFIIFVSSFTILLTGCGNTKDLECEYVDKEAEQIFSYLLKYNKSGDLKSIMFKTVFQNYIKDELSEEERAEFASECEDINQLGLKDVSCKVNIKDKNVEIVVTATDVDKMENGEIELVELDEFVYYNYEGMKKEIEDWGFVCK